MASPAYSMTWPVPPAVPISPMMDRMMSLAVTPSGSLPSTVTRMFLAFLCVSVWVASTCSTSLRADAHGQRAEGAVRGGVAVAADDGGAGQREALLRPDHVHDALPHVALVVVLDAEVLGVPGQRLDLDAAFLVLDALVAVGGGGDVVVDHGQRLLGRAHLALRPSSGPRRPAGSSPRARDGGRCRECTCRPAAARRRGRRRSCRRASWVPSWPLRARPLELSAPVIARRRDARKRCPKRRPGARPGLRGIATALEEGG